MFINQKAQICFQKGGSVIYDQGTSPLTDQISTNNEYLESQLLYCRYLGRSVLKDFFFQRRRKQRFLSIEYVYSGEICIRSEDIAYVAEAGDLCLLHPDRDHDLLFEGHKECRKLGMIISGRVLMDVLKSLQLDRVNIIRLQDTRRLDGLFDHIRSNLLNVINHTACEKIAGNVFELLQMLANTNLSQPVPLALTVLKEYLEQHFSEDLNMRLLAANHNMSLPTMNKLFRAVLHTTPYQYLIQVRMHRAAYLLAENHLTIKEISALIGYNNPLHFSSEFHNMHGCSPREYRKNSRVQ